MFCKKCGTEFFPEAHYSYDFFCPHCNCNNDMNKKRDKITNTERYELLSKARWKCQLCGKRVKMHWYTNAPGTIAHIDHIHPISKIDSYKDCIWGKKNLQVLCEECNRKKGSKVENVNYGA